jgi:hypothetical protein
MSDQAKSLQHHGRPGWQPGSALMNLSAIITRCEETIETETASIRTDVHFDIKGSNARKSRHLYELNKAVAALNGTALRQEHRDGLLRLRAKLELNERAILAHLNAVGEVAALLQDAIQRSEADGTYSASEFGRVTSPA